MKKKSEIWIIDDHKLFSAGMKYLLQSVTVEQQIRCFDNPADADLSEEIAELSLIILDFYIPGVDVITWIQLFSRKYNSTPLVVISSSTSHTDRKNSINAGAIAYYPKHAPPDYTLRYLNQFIHGSQGCRDIEPYILHNHKQLTARQTEILIQLARGHSNKKIAKLLEVSPETIKSHLAAIYKILNCTSRDDAVVWARDNGLL
ncbi:MAG: response regulator transcription factor [Candidatus Thiodiazotropha sp.]|jgi:DNA-binding NarL/FixJ family response regulator